MKPAPLQLIVWLAVTSGIAGAANAEPSPFWPTEGTRTASRFDVAEEDPCGEFAEKDDSNSAIRLLIRFDPRHADRRWLEPLVFTPRSQRRRVTRRVRVGSAAALRAALSGKRADRAGVRQGC